MTLHADVADALGMPVFFCEKSSPWQQPAVEVAAGGGSWVALRALASRIRSHRRR